MTDVVTDAVTEAVAEAVTKAVRRWQRLEAAREAVRPVIGDVPLALDSVNAIYAQALPALGVENADVFREQGGAKTVFNMMRESPATRTMRAKMAADSAAAPHRLEMFPNANRLIRS